MEPSGCCHPVYYVVTILIDWTVIGDMDTQVFFRQGHKKEGIVLRPFRYLLWGDNVLLSDGSYSQKIWRVHMAITIGDTIPSVTIKHLTADGMQEINTAELFANKKVVMFSVPGAFTPTCSSTHLPGYLAKASEIKQQGVDEIVCVAVNDPFVMKAWSETQNVDGKVVMLPDGNGDFTKAMGLDIDIGKAGLGVRGKRFSLVADDGKVTDLKIEESPGEVVVSGADSCLIQS